MYLLCRSYVFIDHWLQLFLGGFEGGGDGFFWRIPVFNEIPAPRPGNLQKRGKGTRVVVNIKMPFPVADRVVPAEVFPDSRFPLSANTLGQPRHEFFSRLSDPLKLGKRATPA